jgi:hypothetical protein
MSKTTPDYNKVMEQITMPKCLVFCKNDKTFAYSNDYPALTAFAKSKVPGIDAISFNLILKMTDLDEREEMDGFIITRTRTPNKYFILE